MNNDGTVIESIESPNMQQSRDPSDVRVRQHVNSDARTYQTKTTLIDLTSSAERALRRRPASPVSTQVLFHEQQPSSLQMYGGAAPQQRRQLIELDDNIPAARLAYRPDDLRQPTTLRQEQYATRLYAPNLPSEGVYRRDDGRAQTGYVRPVERRMIYEPVAERQLVQQPVRCITNEPATVMYSDQNAQAYHNNGNEQVYQAPSRSYVTAEPSRRIIVLDTGDPMEGVQRTTNSR